MGEETRDLYSWINEKVYYDDNKIIQSGSRFWGYCMGDDGNSYGIFNDTSLGTF